MSITGPGDADGVQGPELMTRMLRHAERFDTEVINDEINRAELSQRPFRLHGDNAIYTCDSLIIATGARAKYLGLESEQKFSRQRRFGRARLATDFSFATPMSRLSAAGNTAAEEALYLSNIAKTVTLVHRRDELRRRSDFAGSTDGKKSRQRRQHHL